jgi:hypothetical protein
LSAGAAIRSWRAGLLGAALIAGTPAIAAPVASDGIGISAGTGSPATEFTLASLTALPTVGANLHPTPRQAQAIDATAVAPLVVTSGNPFQLTLWNFIASIQAQQQSDYFELAQAQATTIDYTLQNSPPPVPLPASAGLFLLGLVGLGAALLVMSRPGLRRVGTAQAATA